MPWKLSPNSCSIDTHEHVTVYAIWQNTKTGDYLTVRQYYDSYQIVLYNDEHIETAETIFERLRQGLKQNQIEESGGNVLKRFGDKKEAKNVAEELVSHNIVYDELRATA